MAATKEAKALRGAKLLKKTLETAKESVLSSPEPLPTSLVRKLRLPNGEPLSPGMKELLAFDGEWLGMEYDEDEAEIEGVSLEDVVEEHFGEEAVPAFAEASELLSEDCVLLGAESRFPACLYVGETDEAGEYPVLLMSWRTARRGSAGSSPSTWAAQELGGSGAKDIGDVPPAYARSRKASPTRTATGAWSSPPAGEAEEEEEDSEDDS